MYKLIPSSPLLKCLHKEYDDFYLNGFCNFSPISAFRTVVIFALGRFVSMVANFYNLQCPKEFSIGFKCVECKFYVSFFDVPFFQNIVMIPKRSLLHLEFKTLQCCPRHSLFQGHKVIVNMVNCQKCNQCLKCQVSVSVTSIQDCSLRVFFKCHCLCHFRTWLGHVSSSL